MSVSIGSLSKLTGVRVSTIRFYENEGLVAAPPRTVGGHRAYGPEAVDRLQFIRRARELGFSLDEVRQLISFSDGSRRCDETRELAERHLDEIEQKIKDLRGLKRALRTLTDRCAETPADECPIFDALVLGAHGNECPPSR